MPGTCSFRARKAGWEKWTLPGVEVLSIRDAVLTVSPNKQSAGTGGREAGRVSSERCRQSWGEGGRGRGRTSWVQVADDTCDHRPNMEPNAHDDVAELRLVGVNRDLRGRCDCVNCKTGHAGGVVLCLGVKVAHGHVPGGGGIGVRAMHRDHTAVEGYRVNLQ
jgi:hypothetical protein